MCAGRQALSWFLHGIGAGLDRDEAIAAVVVGDGAAAAGEVRIERRRVLVDPMAIATGRVGLPDLDQRVANGAAVAPEHATADDDALAQGLARVLRRQIAVARAHVVRPERRAGQVRERLRQQQERPAR